MGDPKKTKKKYSRPRRPWNKAMLDTERKIKETYGLKNKKELRIAEELLKNKRQNARKLLALELERRIKREKELMDSLVKIGLVKNNASLDDILGLKIDEILERRLQTIVWRKGLANTPKQARQFIVHGHIAINGKKVNGPAYIVKSEEENKIAYYKKEMKLNPKTKDKENKKMKKDETQETKQESGKKEEKKKETTEKAEGKKTAKDEKKENKNDAESKEGKQ